MKQAQVILEQWLVQNKIPHKFLLNIHDEFQISVDEKNAKEVAYLSELAIREAGKELNMRVALGGEAKIGESWKETH